MWMHWNERLEKDVDGASLGALRMLVAIQVLWDVAVLALNGGISRRYAEPTFYFKYPFFEYIRPLTGLAPYAFFTGVALAALAVLVGWRTAWATRILCVLVAYWFLIDASNYTDHAYLLCLLCLLLACLPVNRWMSADRRMGRETQSTLPGWPLGMARLQIAIVFFFSGLSQLNSDWLAGAPLAEWISLSPTHLAKPFAGNVGLATGFAWGLMLFELSAAVWLWSPRLRWIGLPLLMICQTADAIWFRLGVSPSLLLGGSLLFCSPDWPRRLSSPAMALVQRLPPLNSLLNFLGRTCCWIGNLIDRGLSWFDDTPVWGAEKPVNHPANSAPDASFGRVGPRANQPGVLTYGIAAWLILQIALPVRFLVLGVDPRLTRIGEKCAWHGQKIDRQAEFNLFAVMPSQELRWPLEPNDGFPVPLEILTHLPELTGKSLTEGALRDLVRGDEATLPTRIAALGLSESQASRILNAYDKFSRLSLDPHQYEAMIRQPELVRQYCRHAASVVSAVMGETPLLQADLELSLNERPWQRIISADRDLAAIPSTWDLLAALIPLQDRLPDYQTRIAVAQEREVERQKVIDMALPSSGLKRPAEPIKAPGISPEDEARINALP